MEVISRSVDEGRWYACGAVRLSKPLELRHSISLLPFSTNPTGRSRSRLKSDKQCPVLEETWFPERTNGPTESHPIRPGKNVVFRIPEYSDRKQDEFMSQRLLLQPRTHGRALFIRWRSIVTEPFLRQVVRLPNLSLPSLSLLNRLQFGSLIPAGGCKLAVAGPPSILTEAGRPNFLLPLSALAQAVSRFRQVAALSQVGSGQRYDFDGTWFERGAAQAVTVNSSLNDG